jgi:CspA family cold shock protein
VTQGTIKKLVKERGFGFIQTDGDGAEVFFHSSALTEGSYDALEQGQSVVFDVEPDPRNSSRSRAANVRVTE